MSEARVLPASARRLGTTALVALAAALAAPAAASAASTRYASPSGTGTTCSSASPCPLGPAITGAASGDTVYVLPGSSSPDYSSATISVPNGVTVSGAPGARRPVIVFTTSGLSLGSNDTVSGLELRNADTTGTALTDPGGANDVVEAVVASESGGGTALSGGNSSSVTVRDSLLTSSGTNGVALGSSGQLDAINVTAVSTGSSSYGVVSYSSNTGVTPACVAGSAGTVYATNVIARGTGADLRTDYQGCGPGLTSLPQAALTVSTSNFRTATNASGQPVVTQSGGNQTSSSQTADASIFVNEAGGDFHELPGSPTENAGTATPLNGKSLGPTDLDGDPRVLEGQVDIGAAELIPAPSVSTGPTSAITTTAATLTGSINPNGTSAVYAFAYGPTTSYGASTTAVATGAGTAPVAAGGQASGLSPATGYHYALVGATVNADFTQLRFAVGSDMTFTTGANAPPVTPPSQPPAAVPFSFKLASTTARVKRRTGRGTLRGTCTAVSFDRCKVAATLTAPGPRRRHHPRRRVVVGTVSGSVAGGRTGNLTVSLNATGRALLKKSRSFSTSLKGTVGDLAGARKSLAAAVRVVRA